jgi:hypothetical protein
MKKYVSKQNIATLTRIAVLCLLAFLSVSFSPALAATLSRGFDLSAAVSTARSIMVSLCAARDWLPLSGTRARASMDQTNSLMIAGRKAA